MSAFCETESNRPRADAPARRWRVLNEGDFLGWCRRLALTETTQAAIAEVRSRNPTRRVGGGRDNVSGRYPSRKMGITIQFESHRVELPFVYEMEHDPGVSGVLRPAALHSARLSRGKRKTPVGHAHTGLLRDSPRLCGMGGVQTRADLEKLATRAQIVTVGIELGTGDVRREKCTLLALGCTIEYGRRQRSIGFCNGTSSTWTITGASMLAACRSKSVKSSKRRFRQRQVYGSAISSATPRALRAVTTSTY